MEKEIEEAMREPIRIHEVYMERLVDEKVPRYWRMDLWHPFSHIVPLANLNREMQRILEYKLKQLLALLKISIPYSKQSFALHINALQTEMHYLCQTSRALGGFEAMLQVSKRIITESIERRPQEKKKGIFASLFG